MKLAIIGGAGVRTPLLVDGLTRSDLPIEHDRAVRPRRRAPGVIAPLAAAAVRAAPRVTVAASLARMRRRRRLRVHQHPRRRHRAARPRRGGRAAPRHRRPGNGRTRPASRWRCAPSRTMVDYARAGRRARAGRLDHQLHQPGRDGDPGGAHGDRARVIGICDTPTELFEEIAHALGPAVASAAASTTSG